MTPDPEQFVGEYADVDLESGVENAKDRMDRDFRERVEELRRILDDD